MSLYTCDGYGRQGNNAFQEWIDKAKSIKIEDAARKLGIEFKGNQGRPCPSCGGNDRFSISIKKQVFNCRVCREAGGPIALVMLCDWVDFLGACEVLNGSPPPIPKDPWKEFQRDYDRQRAILARSRRLQTEVKQTQRQPWKEPVAVDTYFYKDERGQILYKLDRIQYRNRDGSAVLTDDNKPLKSFRAYHRAYDDEGGFHYWGSGLNGSRRVPYQLPRLLKAIAAGQIIYFVEGERKADFLIEELGLASTCVAFGAAGGWRPDYGYGQFFEQAKVVILPDNDAPGLRFAGTVAEALTPIASSVQIVRLPGLPPKGDVIDFFKGC